MSHFASFVSRRVIILVRERPETGCNATSTRGEERNRFAASATRESARNSSCECKIVLYNKGEPQGACTPHGSRIASAFGFTCGAPFPCGLGARSVITRNQLDDAGSELQEQNRQLSKAQNGHGHHLQSSRILRGRGTKPPDRIRASQYSEPVLRFHGAHHHGKPSRSCAVPTPFPRAFHVSCLLFQYGFVIPRGTAILPGRTRRGLPSGRCGPRRERRA